MGVCEIPLGNAGWRIRCAGAEGTRSLALGTLGAADSNASMRSRCHVDVVSTVSGPCVRTCHERAPFAWRGHPLPTGRSSRGHVADGDEGPFEFAQCSRYFGEPGRRSQHGLCPRPELAQLTQWQQIQVRTGWACCVASGPELRSFALRPRLLTRCVSSWLRRSLRPPASLLTLELGLRLGKWGAARFVLPRRRLLRVYHPPGRARERTYLPRTVVTRLGAL